MRSVITDHVLCSPLSLPPLLPMAGTWGAVYLVTKAVGITGAAAGWNIELYCWFENLQQEKEQERKQK